jgi:hypothetical protein
LSNPSRKAKGKRPVYFNDPENDKLLAITIAGQLSCKERILRVVHHELESAEKSETPESYENALKLVSSS